MQNNVFLKKKKNPKNQIILFLFSPPIEPIFFAVFSADYKTDLVSPNVLLLMYFKHVSIGFNVYH